MDEGRLSSAGEMLYVEDYLGSVRAVVSGSGGTLLEASDYSAFGARATAPSAPIGTTPSGITLRDHYTAQEDQAPDFAVPYTDFGARQYNVGLRRWMTPDPLSEKYYGISPYAFCNNSPMVFVDRDGRIIDTAIDVVSITLGVKSLVSNIKAGNVWAAVGDGAGIAIDAIAAAIPFVPGGVGAIRAGVKAADAFDDIADAAKITVSPSSFNKFTLAPTTKTVKNPYGAKGKPDHQAKVGQLKENAKAELKPGEIILSEEKIRINGSNRKPDVQIIDNEGKTRKVFEAERYPNRKRNRDRENEYKMLNIEYETHSLY